MGAVTKPIWPRYCRRYWLGGTEFGEYWLVWDGVCWWTRPGMPGIDTPEDLARCRRVWALEERLQRLLPVPLA